MDEVSEALLELIEKIKQTPEVDVDALREKALEELATDPEYQKTQSEIKYLQTVNDIFEGKYRSAENKTAPGDPQHV